MLFKFFDKSAAERKAFTSMKWQRTLHALIVS